MSETYPTGTIHDGMERKGFIPAMNYVHQAVRFWYRPMGIKARAAYLDGLNRQKNAVDQETLSVAMICRQLVRWNMTYPENWPDDTKAGKPVPVSNADELIVVLDPHISRLMSAIIVGLIESPLDPDDTEKKRAEDAMKQGLSPQAVIESMNAAELERQGN